VGVGEVRALRRIRVSETGFKRQTETLKHGLQFGYTLIEGDASFSADFQAQFSYLCTKVQMELGYV